MCNLSEGIEERGIIKGRTELLKQQVRKKLAKGQCVEVIAEDLVEEVEVIRTIVDEIQTKEQVSKKEAIAMRQLPSSYPL